MNKQRRKDLQKALELIAEARSIIETAQEEEQESFDNLPESIQYGEQGERMQENADNLEEIVSYLEDQESTLEDIING